jgi:DNA-binding MarR family transcriptional regulator
VTYDPRQPAYRLHTLVAALDAAADEMLRAAHGTSYARFLTLVTVQALGTPTQAELAAAQEVSAPAASRMVRTLSEAGLLTAARTPGTGNRSALTLTPAGERLVADGGALLEDAFGRLLEAGGVTVDQVRAVTDPLLQVLRPETA